jgi:hypothetical protein
MAERFETLLKRGLLDSSERPYTLEQLDALESEKIKENKKASEGMGKSKGPMTKTGKTLDGSQGFRTGSNRPSAPSPLSASLQKSLQSGKGLLGTVGRIPGIGLLGTVGRFATGPIGLGLTGAYYGARALGYDPLGLNTEAPKAPTPIGYDVNRDTPKSVPEARYSQIFNPTSQATGKEIINAALMRAALGQDVGSVGDFRTKFRTGKDAFEAGKENLGEGADIRVSQTKDGDYVYSGGQSGNPLNSMMNALTGRQTVTQEQFDQLLQKAKEKLPNETEEKLLEALNKKYIVGE